MAADRAHSRQCGGTRVARADALGACGRVAAQLAYRRAVGTRVADSGDIVGSALEARAGGVGAQTSTEHRSDSRRRFAQHGPVGEWATEFLTRAAGAERATFRATASTAAEVPDAFV